MTGRRIGLQSKLILLCIGLVMLTATGIAGFVVHREITARYQDLVNTGLTTATVIAQSSEYSIYTENQDSLRRIIAGFQASPDIAYVAVFGKQSKILLEQTFGTALTLPTTLRSRLPASGKIVFEDVVLQPGGASYIDIMVPVVGRQVSSSDPLFLESTAASSQTVVIGYVQLGLSQVRLQENLQQFVLTTGFVVVIVLLVGLVLALVLTRNITGPIQTLVEATGLIAEGRFDVDVAVHTSDEVNQLAGAFNRMTAQLRISQKQIQEYQQGLEDKVAERTRQLETALQDAHRLTDEAQAASRAKSQFLANMSHEIRTPMNGVLGMTELLLAATQDGRQRHLTETIQRSGEALLAVINDILDFSKIEAGKLQLEQLDFDVQDTVEDAVELFATPAQHKGLELTCHLAGSFQRALRGDPVRLRQALLNLLGNAVKFTAQGEIRVLVEAVAETAEAVTLRFAVQDSGIGIPPLAQARVFEAFSQADGSTTRRFGGTGLGLTIVKELVALMQGQIGVESRPGEGSTFWFTAVFPRQAGAAESAAPEASTLRDQRILVVDDTATNREILDEHLRSWGATPTLTASGAGALACLHAALDADQPFDLAILDLHMPEMDGLMLAQAIRNKKAWAGLRLLMLTSVGYDAGGPDVSNVDSWVTKPIRKTMLYQALLGLTRANSSVTPSLDHIQAPAGAPARINPLNVLLVEDTPVNREVAIGMLELLGHRVDVAENGQEAVDATTHKPYDIVLMDCQMPVMDGFAATGAIREREHSGDSTKRLAIIALTAHAVEGDRERCLAAGMDDYLTKPFTLQQLQDLLARWAPGTPNPIGAPSGENHPAPTTQSVIDETAWQAIRALQRPDRPNLLHKTLTLYLAHSQSLMDQFQQALTQQDLSAAQIATHTLKSSSAQLGAQHLAELCKEVEAACRAGTSEQLPALVPLLVTAHRNVCAAFQAALNKERPHAA